MADYLAIALLGPTAAGKTDLGIALAENFQGEIVNLDSVQIYRYMDIGSAKPTAEEQERVAHHLIDLGNPDQTLNSFALFEQALQKGQEIACRGKLPIFTGGTGLYFKAIFYGMFSGPPANQEFRARFRQRIADEGLESLYRELSAIDPESAARIASQDALRIERALEIFTLTGRTKSELEHNQNYESPFDFIKVAITYPRVELYERINRRVDIMLERGLIAEVKYLEQEFPGADILKSAIGYKEVLSYLEKEMEYDEMVNLLKQNSRRFAKRQLTLFKALKDLKWFCPPEREEVLKYVREELEVKGYGR